MLVRPHPWRDVAIVAAYNTPQARTLLGETTGTIVAAAVRGALAECGLCVDDVDGVWIRPRPRQWVFDLGIGPAWTGEAAGIMGVIEAASAIACGQCETAIVASGGAGHYLDRSSTAPWTRPEHEFVVPFGLYTAAEFALVARRHMVRYGTTPEQLATVAALIRNNGHVNPAAAYYGRGPYTADDVLSSRMVADPFHLLDCSITSEGACALVLTTAERAAHLPSTPVHLLGGGAEVFGPSYEYPPAFDLAHRRDRSLVAGFVGKRAADRAFAMAGIGRDEVDVLELYDAFSFEVIRQLEAFGFCAPGEGGQLALDGALGPGGRFPVTTDGGTLSFSHAANASQMLQRAARAVHQLRGECVSMQVPGASIALCSSGGAGALFNHVLILGTERP